MILCVFLSRTLDPFALHVLQKMPWPARWPSLEGTFFLPVNGGNRYEWRNSKLEFDLVLMVAGVSVIRVSAKVFGKMSFNS